MNIQVLKTYTHQGLCRAVDIFNYPKEFPNHTRLLGFRFLLENYHRDRLCPTKEEIIRRMKIMVDDHYSTGTQESHSILMDLVDMLIDFSPPDGEALLAYLREIRATANDEGPDVNDIGPECTVYGDSQSSHNKSISDSTRLAAKYLMSKYGKRLSSLGTQKYEQVKRALIDRYSDSVNDIESIIDRIYMDNAHFGIGCSVDEILMALLNWIDIKKKGDRKFPVDSIYQRLGEEFAEMNNYCSSGILSRLINSIQGFTGDETGLEIKISDREQVKSVVYNYLNRSIQECSDEKVTDGMLDGSDIFISFVKGAVTLKIDIWRKEYGDSFISYVEEIVNEYTNVMIYE